MIRRNRDADARGPVAEGDFEDRAAGLRAGDAAWAGASEIGTRLSNIERVEQHLIAHPDAVLNLTPLHPQVLARFSDSQRTFIQIDLALHNLAELAEAIGIAVVDLAAVITGTLVGGPVGFTLAAGSTAFGIRQTIGAFEHVSLLQSMTQLGFTAESALATPEMVSSARMWARIGVGLALIDVAGLAGGARIMARLRSVLADPDLARVLNYTRGNLREAAEALGVSERALVRDLHTLEGAERTQLLERIRVALEPRVTGGRHFLTAENLAEWGEGYTVEVLMRMRRALLDDVGDVDRVVQALRQSGIDFAQQGVVLDRSMVATIKRYIFDSPGIRFSRQNYDAWLRLSSGRGSIGDARFLVHEATEIGGFRRAGVNFLGEGYEEMGRHVRTRWRQEFGPAYMSAHRAAIEAEYDFVASQVSAFAGGRADITREVVAAVDQSLSGRQARQLMQVGEGVLEDHPRFYTWRSRGREGVELSPAARERLGNALFDGIRLTEGEFRAAEVARQGANPTLAELIAAVKAMGI
jgi:hypothetical protein